MTSQAQILDFEMPAAPARFLSPGPHWGLLALWAGFAVVAIGGLGASLALPNPATEHVRMPAAAAEAPLASVRVPKRDALEVRVARLKKKLAADASDGDRWLLLAQTHGQLQQFEDSAAAYRRAAMRLTPDATLLADWASAQWMAKGRQWDDETRQLVDRALRADGVNVKALALAGSEAYDRRDYAAATTFWRRMKAEAPAGSMERRLAEVNIAEAQRLIGDHP